jgi:hypothetical protein
MQKSHLRLHPSGFWIAAAKEYCGAQKIDKTPEV